MADDLDDLRDRMEAASAAMDFEEARRLRDMMNLIRGGASREEAEAADTSGLDRQKPGAMGLGSSRQSVTPPAGWRRPPKPDLRTRRS